MEGDQKLLLCTPKARGDQKGALKAAPALEPSALSLGPYLTVLGARGLQHLLCRQQHAAAFVFLGPEQGCKKQKPSMSFEGREIPPPLQSAPTPPVSTCGILEWGRGGNRLKPSTLLRHSRGARPLRSSAGAGMYPVAGAEGTWAITPARGEDAVKAPATYFIPPLTPQRPTRPGSGATGLNERLQSTLRSEMKAWPRSDSAKAVPFCTLLSSQPTIKHTESQTAPTPDSALLAAEGQEGAEATL